MNKRVQRVENAACLGGISRPCNEKVRLYERAANDYLTVTIVSETICDRLTIKATQAILFSVKS